MRNLWQEEREIVNHTYISHYFIDLISRQKFKNLLLSKKFDSQEIQEIIINFYEIEKKVKHLLRWANPYAIESAKISELSHLYGVELEDELVLNYFQERENYYKTKYIDRVNPKIEKTVMALKSVSKYIDELKNKSDNIDENFLNSFRNKVYILSESLRSFKEVENHEK